jgi:hypothetical protein
MIWPDDMNMPPFSGDDHHAEAHRLLDTAPRRSTSATAPWVVLSIPEGNELCLLTPR